MVIYKNECCGCAVSGYPCLGDLCARRKTPYFICDRCRNEVEMLRDVDGEQLCEDCLLEEFEIVKAE